MATLPFTSWLTSPKWADLSPLFVDMAALDLAVLDLGGWKPWHFWILAAFGVVILEMVTQGFVLGCLALGCFVASMSALLGADNLLAQIWICAGVTFISFFLVRPLVLRTTRGVNAATGTDVLVGQRTVVAEPESEDAAATAKVGGELWRIQSQNGKPLHVGDPVLVVGVDGNRLIVEHSA